MKKILSLAVVSLVCLSGLIASVAFASPVAPPAPAPAVVMADPLPLDLSSASAPVVTRRVVNARTTVIVADAAPAKHMVCRGPWIRLDEVGGFRRCEME